MSDIQQRIDLIQGLAQRMQTVLVDLSEEDWARPSACDAWEVRDVLGHLIGGAERQIENLKRGLNGESGPPEGFVPLDADGISANNARTYVALRESLGDRLLSVFNQRYEELGETLNSLGADKWDTLCWHMRRGIMTAEDYVDLRIQEMTIHDWDMRSAFDPDCRLDADCVVRLLEIAPMWLGMTFRPGTDIPEARVFRFELDDHPSHSHDVSVTGSKFQVGPASSRQADALLRCDGDSYLLYIYGRIDSTSLRLKIEAEPALMGQFEAWFKGL